MRLAQSCRKAVAWGVTPGPNKADAGDEPASIFSAFGRFWRSGFAPDP
jgi:hypothetical protein